MRTKMTNELVCPHCGAIQEQLYKLPESKVVECQKCKKKFEYEIHIFFSTWKEKEYD